MKIHPLAALAPKLTPEELDELAADIAKNGLIAPIEILPDGSVIDGANRLAACELAGVEPETVEVDPANPAEYVVSKNVRRRHLTPAQRAALLEALSCGQSGEELSHNRVADIGHPPPPKSQNVTSTNVKAKVAGVSRDTMQKAARVKTEHPENLKPVIDGEMTLDDALADCDRAAEKQDTVEPEVDRYGNHIVKPLRDLFTRQTTDVIREARRAIAACEKAMDAILSSPMEIFFGRSQAREGFRVLKDCVAKRNIEPHCVCPVCGGDAVTRVANKCQYCKKLGWVTKTALQLIPHEYTKHLKSNVRDSDE